jgi:hypothetical protein
MYLVDSVDAWTRQHPDVVTGRREVRDLGGSVVGSLRNGSRGTAHGANIPTKLSTWAASQSTTGAQRRSTLLAHPLRRT